MRSHSLSTLVCLAATGRYGASRCTASGKVSARAKWKSISVSARACAHSQKVVKVEAGYLWGRERDVCNVYRTGTSITFGECNDLQLFSPPFSSQPLSLIQKYNLPQLLFSHDVVPDQPTCDLLNTRARFVVHGRHESRAQQRENPQLCLSKVSAVLWGWVSVKLSASSGWAVLHVCGIISAGKGTV